MKPARKVRRIMKANAATIADEYAAGVFDYDANGKRVKVTDPLAVKALRRAFIIMLQAGGEPQVVRISHDAACAFPRATQPPEGVPAYLAVGVDREGRGTYSLRHIMTPGAPANVEDMLNRNAALECLKPHTATSGFPDERAAT